jgi:LysR family transcriptional regulator, positive regulator for ilvC
MLCKMIYSTHNILIIATIAMDITQLKMVVELAHALHFHRAAEQCHVSPSTLSRSIAQLEDQLKVVLFERDNRSVAITRQGEKVLAFARETLAQWDELKDALQSESQDLRGSLSLYCSVTASYSFLYEILTDFRQQHPFIELKIHTGDPALAVERVLAGHEDLAIAAHADTMPRDINFKRFTYSPLVLIQSINSDNSEFLNHFNHQYWQTIPFIISEQGVARERLNNWFRRKKITPNVYAQVTGHEAIVSMVSLGFGVGLVPQIVLENSPLSNKVKHHPVQPQLKPYEVGVCVLARRLKSPLIRAFWEQINSHSII